MKKWSWPIEKYWPFIYRKGKYIFLQGCTTKHRARKLLCEHKQPKGIMT